MVALSFLSMVQGLGYAGSFFFFAAVSLASVLFYALAVPETKVSYYCHPPPPPFPPWLAD